METVKQHINASKSIEVIADVICKITTIYNLQTKYTYALTHDQKTGLSNYDSYIKTIRNINTDIYSTFGMIEITIINLKNIISGMASSKVMKSYSSSHKQLLNFLIKNHVIGSVMPIL